MPLLVGRLRRSTATRHLPCRLPQIFVILLLQCYSTAVCQLNRTSDSTCDSIACEGVVQYECVVNNSGTGVVWRIPGCPDLQIINQGGVAGPKDGVCDDGTTFIMAQGNEGVNGSSFISYLVVNITGSGQPEDLTVMCLFDDGLTERLIGTEELTARTAPAPDNLRQTNFSDSRIVVIWDPVLDGCSVVHFNFNHSRTCGTCVAGDDNIVTCTNVMVGECNLTVHTVICGVAVNQSTLIIINRDVTSQSPMPADTTTSCILCSIQQGVSFTPGVITAIVVAPMIVLAVILAIAIPMCICICYRRRQNGKLKLHEEHRKLELSTVTSSGVTNSGEVKGVDISSSNGIDADPGGPVDTSTPERDCGIDDYIHVQVERPPSVNVSTVSANSATPSRGEVGEGITGDNTEDQTSDQLKESTEAGNSDGTPTDIQQKEGLDGSDGDVQDSCITAERGSTNDTLNEHCKLELSNVTSSGVTGSVEVKGVDISSSNGIDADPGGPVDTSTPERDCGIDDHIHVQVERPPSVNVSTASANSTTRSRGEVGEGSTGDSTEDQTGNQLNESTEAGNGDSTPTEKEGLNESDGDVQDSSTATEHGSTKDTQNSARVSPEGCYAQPTAGGGDSGDKDDKYPGDDVDNKDLPLPVEESSPDLDNAGSKGTKQEPQLTEQILHSNGFGNQPSLPTNPIKETSQEPSSPDPFVTVEINGTRMIPSSSTHRSVEPKIFHMPPPSDPVQQDSAGRSLGATGGLAHLDEELLLSKFQNILEKSLAPIQGDKEKIKAIEKGLEGNKEKIEAVEKQLKEEITKKDNQISKLKKDMSKLRSQFASIEKELQDEREEKEKLKKELHSLKEMTASQLEKKQKEIDQLKSEKEELEAQFNKKKRSSFSSQSATL